MKRTLVLIWVLGSYLAQSQTNENTQVEIKPINELNTLYTEANVLVTPDRKYLYFMSTRGGEPWSNGQHRRKNRLDNGDADLFVSERINGKWTGAKNLGPIVNTSQNEDEPLINADRSVLIFESWRLDWQRTGGPYYKYNAELEEIETLHPAITRFFIRTRYQATDGTCLSPNGQLFLFAAGPTLEGNMNIYYIVLSDPMARVRSMGINTVKNERTPFIASDGTTLYFSSDGYGGHGGLDVLKTTWESGEFGEVLNLGSPINSAKNDYNFTLEAGAEWAYMVKNKDIYEIDFRTISTKLKPKITVISSEAEKEIKETKELDDSSE